MRVHKTDDADRFPRFSFVRDKFFHDKTSFIITGDNLLYILSVMNSRLMNYFMHKNIAVLDTGGFLVQKIYVELFPIPKVEDSIQAIVESLVEKILIMRSEHDDTSELEDQIDAIIYDRFALSVEEIAYIEENTP